MSTPQPATLQVDDAISDTLARCVEIFDEVKETLKRIARAVESLSTTGAD